MTVKHEEMTVRNFIKLSADIDIYDDVCEELGVAFCGPMGLTEKGEIYFKEILPLRVTIYTDDRGYSTAVLHIDDPDERLWKRRLKLAIDMFYGMAGYCDEETFNELFIAEWRY